VSRRSWAWVSDISNLSPVSDARGLIRGLGGSRPETFSGSNTSGLGLGPVNY
jgi:hypothetical protein